LSGNYLNSSDLAAYGFRINAWDTLEGAQEAYITDMSADTVNDITLVVMGGSLYRQGERYYIWDAVVKNLASLRTIDIDKDRIFYASTWDGDLIKSPDHGQSWELCTRPYSQINYYLHVYISNDNYLWVSSYNLPIKYSKDSGQTWTELGAEMSIHGLDEIFRLKDGSLLLHGSDCCSLFRSFDEGVSWTKIETPGYSQNLYVNDNDEIFIIVSAFTIYKSTDYGATFSYAYATSPQWGSTSENVFNKVGNFYYILVQGWGILKSSDLTHYEDYWYNSDIRDLFIDHNGVMIAMYWNYQTPYQHTVYYRKNSEK
jgi:photosystem II stability/assembly factor-like uncharacterized protein